MDIIKFYQFNEDVMISSLDCVIDEFGNVYNGFNKQYPLRKGNIVKRKVAGVNQVVSILGYDKKEYVAGIDKNGFLVIALPFKSDDGYLLDTLGKKVKIPNYITDVRPAVVRSKYWKIGDDYSKIVPYTPTGWVNTKIDMEVIKRVRRYSKGLSGGRGIKGLISKLSDLERLSSGAVKRRQRSRETVQKEMSVIMLLHFINEIKDYFTPSSSGFLFESFIGGLIKNSKVIEDNSKADIYADGESWQIKLYDGLASTVSVAYMPDDSPLDHYIIALKYADRIEVIILEGIDDATNPSSYLNFITGGGSFSISKARNAPMKYTIETLGIEDKIQSIAAGLKESIDDIYKDLSIFQYNIESIITGVDEKGKLLNDQKFEETYTNSMSIVQNLDKKVTSLYKTIKREE